jgi:hypothetical protein
MDNWFVIKSIKSKEKETFIICEFAYLKVSQNFFLHLPLSCCFARTILSGNMIEPRKRQFTQLSSRPNTPKVVVAVRLVPEKIIVLNGAFQNFF